jgi:hypothetical protein
VEEVLYKHPKIKAAGVVGVPDPKVGQLIKAYVVLKAMPGARFPKRNHGILPGNWPITRSPESSSSGGNCPKPTWARCPAGSCGKKWRSHKMGEPFLEISGLSKRFGGLRAVNDVGFPWVVMKSWA